MAFAIYVVAAIMLEATEMWKDLAGYLLDRWKAPHFLALVVALAAFLARAIDSDSSWGRGLYAVGSPLMYWRLLYYAQVIPSQGSTIQVLYGMASELGQFFVVMGVVILGFAMSFFALFRDVKGETLRGALLDAFQAMLGEVGLFDDFVGEKHDLAATVLLVSYLVVMTIMLLNLLIAVLSTAHGKVEEEVLIRVSRARVYTHYRWVVATDALPAPFNLAQLVVLLPCQMVDLLFKSNPARRGANCILARVGSWRGFRRDFRVAGVHSESPVRDLPQAVAFDCFESGTDNAVPVVDHPCCTSVPCGFMGDPGNACTLRTYLWS
ncbi:unnamed protein product [Ectocarpus sp. 12 AP-2014]